MSDLIADRYRVGHELGSGGMGVVHAGFDITLERPVAIKLLSESALSADGRDRLLREAKAAAGLKHPNVITVHDAGEVDGVPYIVMELVEGESLHQARPRELSTIIELAIQLASALDHAHGQRIIHRDLKPENVILERGGEAKLMDFGLARSVASRLTQEGTVVGSVFYLSPEQAMGKAVDARSDLYSLGVMLYELTTGNLPFEAAEALAVISQHLHASPVRPSIFRDDLDPEFETIILKLLEKDPDDRFDSAGELITALESLKSFGTRETLVDEEALPVAPTLDDLAHGRMVGRKAELTDLLKLWSRVRDGRGQLALISGEPGVGKTRLAEEVIFRVHLQGATVLRGGCYEFEAATPYMPFVEALREWVRGVDSKTLSRFLDSTAPAIARLAPEIEAKIGPLEPLPPLSPNEERLRLFDSVSRLFRRISSEKGILLFLDDLHWADQGTLNLMHYLLRHLRHDEVFIVACYREVELDRAHPLADSLVAWNREHLATRIGLDRFTLDETRELLNTLFQEGGSAPFVEAVHQETEGNPFFIEEVIKALVDSGAVYREGRRWARVEIEDLAIPQSVKEAIGRRLNRLSQSCTSSLHVAAVLGKQFAYEELAELSADEEQVLDALDEARQAQLIRSAGGENFSFTHDKIREVLYQELNPVRRRRLHMRIGEMLERRYHDDLEAKVQDLAHHFTEAGDLARGYSYSVQATEHAIALYALDQAIDIVEKAVDCAIGLEDPAKEKEAYHLQSQAYGTRGRFPQAIQAVKEAIARTKDPLEAAKLKVEQGGYHTLLSDPAGLSVLQEAVEVLEAEKDSADLANAITLLGRFHHYQARHRLAIEHYQRALAIAEPLKDHFAVFNACAYLAGGHQHLVETETSNEYARRCIAHGEDHDLPISVAAGHEFLAENAFFSGEWTRALHHAKEDHRIGEEYGFLDRVAWAMMAQCAAHTGMGSLARAVETGEQTIDLAEDLEEIRLTVWATGYLTMALTDLGEFDEARSRAQLALERAESLQQVALRTYARSSLAYVLFRDADPIAALGLMQEAREIVAGTENIISYTWIYPLQCAMNASLGRFVELHEDLPHMLEVARKGGSGFMEGVALRYQALLDAREEDHESARFHFDRSVELLETSSSRPEWARSLLARGQWRSGLQHDDSAAADVEKAIELLTACEMSPELQQALLVKDEILNS